jgi:hypothetical protein
MQFNQTNNNAGDVNNAIAEKGTVVQIVGNSKARDLEENVSDRLPRTDAEADLLKPAIVELLQTIPETWAEFDNDKLTAVQSNALFLLVAAGLVERRFRVRLQMLSHPTIYEATLAVTGEAGFVDAMKPLTATAWKDWRDAYQVWKDGEHADAPAVHCESVRPDEWRLTDQGMIGRGDISGAGAEMTIDFVLKRGFFGPGHWFLKAYSRNLSDDDKRTIARHQQAGHNVAELARPSVLGTGRLVEFHKITNPTCSQPVNLTNWRESADTFATVIGKLVEPMFEAISKGQQVRSCEEPCATEKCQILFLAASPAGTKALALDEECREIEQKIRAADYRDALDFVQKWAVRPDDLLQYLNQFKPRVVHFSGHGSRREEIVLLDKDRQPKPVGKAALKQLFSTLKDNIRLVVLNACFSRPQAEAIVEVIDCAIGMKQAIGDKAAITFAASFYRAIGFGRTIREAFDQGKAALMLEGIPEQDTPELLVRPGVDPNAIFLVTYEASEF